MYMQVVLINMFEINVFEHQIYMDGLSNHKMGMNKTKKIAHTSMMVAAAVTLRIMKNLILGPIQFINFPAIFTILGGVLLGPVSGMFIGFASYLISDMLLLPGLWTVVNSLLMAGIGFLCGIFLRRASKIGIGIGAFLLMFCFDVMNSWLLYILMGFDWFYAFIIAIIGLFLPAGGGFLYGIGPITELVTILVALGLINVIKRNRLELR